MIELIIICFIIYTIYKKANIITPDNLKNILIKKGFRNITTVRQILSSTWITADFHGDNYLFAVIKAGHSVSKETIEEIYRYASQKHYHNIILVPGNAPILTTARTSISSYNIQIWNNSMLTNISSNSNEIISSVVQKAPIEDNCVIEESIDPIQDGSKANSIFGNLFGNKIEKL